jgi:hypothetical protein
MINDNCIEMVIIHPSKSKNKVIIEAYEREQKYILKEHKAYITNEYSKIIDNYSLDKIKEEIRIIEYQILNYIIYIKSCLILNYKVKWTTFNETEKNEFIEKLKKENYNIIKFEIKLKLLKERLASKTKITKRY